MLIAACLPETCRNIVGNGSIPGRRINRTILSNFGRSSAVSAGQLETSRPRFRFPNPFSCLRIIFHKDTALVLLANAIFYMNYSCMQASLSPLLMQIYDLNALQVGLTYLAYGLGCGVASYLAGKALLIGSLCVVRILTGLYHFILAILLLSSYQIITNFSSRRLICDI